MKKKLRKLLCILLTAVLCLGIAVPASATSSKYSAATNAYYSYMRGKSGYYKIVDIDKNGVPELLINDRSKTANEIYTYNTKTRRIVRLGSIMYGKGYRMPIYYSRTSHTAMICNANTGGQTYYLYKINGTRATRLVNGEVYNGKFQSGYSINGRKVSRTTFRKTIRKYMKNAVTVTIGQ